MKFHFPSIPDPTIIAFLGNSYAANVTPDKSDVIIHPCLIRGLGNSEQQLKKIEALYKSFRKKIVVFVLDDFEFNYKPFNNLLIWRTSLRKSMKAANEFAMPYLWECKDEAFLPSSLTALPTVGFCGLSNEYRKKSIAIFSEDSDIHADFVVRSDFWGGSPHNEKLMYEYWTNLNQNQFVLASRGVGNFSMRFYQALSIGRIPVVVNTDIELPFSDKINWQDAIVFHPTEDECLKQVKEIHRLSHITERQKKCYNIFHEYLSQKSFSYHLEATIKDYLSSLQATKQSLLRKWLTR